MKDHELFKLLGSGVTVNVHVNGESWPTVKALQACGLVTMWETGENEVGAMLRQDPLPIKSRTFMATKMSPHNWVCGNEYESVESCRRAISNRHAEFKNDGVGFEPDLLIPVTVTTLNHHP